MKRAVFSQSQHDYKCDIDFIQQFNKQEVNIRDYVLDTILPVFAPFRQQKIIPNKATALFCVSEQHDGVLFLNESTV